MKKHKLLIAFFPWLLFAQTDSLYLRLPEFIYSTTSSCYSLYFKNIVLTQSPESYSFEVNCPVGRNEENRYILDSLDAGVYPFSLVVKDSIGNVIESKESQVIVTENSICSNDTLKILLVGNSLTNLGIYQKYVKQFLEESSSNPVKFLGTMYYSLQDSLDGILHEGRSGWMWGNYCRNSNSPFVYGAYPAVDIERYINEKLNGERPDIVTFCLGVNDIFNLDSSTLETIDAGITNIFANWNMGLVIDKFQVALPDAEIGIVLIPVANERLEPWYIQYGDSAKAWEYRKCQHRLEQRYIDHFKALNKPNFSMIPVYPNIDTFLGYPADNARHPNNYGYEQMAQSIYGWIKYQISQWMTEPKNISISYSGSSVNLIWDASSGVYLYHIYRSSEPYGQFNEIGTSNVPSYTDTTITGSSKYFYKVTADNFLK